MTEDRRPSSSQRADAQAAKPGQARTSGTARKSAGTPAQGSKPARDQIANERVAKQPAPVAEEGTLGRPSAAAADAEVATPPASADHDPDGSQNSHDSDAPTGLRLLMAAGRPRASRGQIVVALLCALLGFALVTQVHSQSGAGLSSARQADLVDVLDNLSAKSEQLRSQINQEQETLSKLTGGADQTQAALEEAQQRATTLRILAGTIGATGPGIDLRIADPQHKVTADVLLDTLEELRDAGAEAVELRGSAPTTAGSAAQTSAAGDSSSAAPGGAPAVRLVASSYFVDSQDGSGVVADGTPLSPPYDLLAIGDPPTLSQAMAIPGGVLDTLKGKGASGQVTQADVVQVTALHALTAPKYAHPAASPSTAS